MSVKAIPDGYHSVTPYLIVDGAEEALDWYAKALGAVEQMRMAMPAPSGVEGNGKIGHAEIKIGNSHVMLSDEWPDMDLRGPKSRGGATASLMVYLEGVDAAFKRALDAGGTEERPPQDQPWGDRMGTFIDPFGHRWTLATHVEDVSGEEIGRRMEEWAKENA